MLIWSIGSLQLSLRPGAYGVSIAKKLAFNSRLFLYRAPLREYKAVWSLSSWFLKSWTTVFS